MTDSAPRPEFEDLLEVPVPAGGRVLVVSDLHLSARSQHHGRHAVDEVTRAIEACDGPGVVVLNGDIVELLAGDDPDVAAILGSHRRFVDAVRRFGEGPGRSVIYLIGNHDWKLAWDAKAAAAVCKAFGARLALTADLVLETGQGERRVRVEHGNRLDPANRFTDIRNPLDAPLGHHVVRELLPALRSGERDWLEGVAVLSDPIAFPEFVASRLAYRRLARHLKWLVLPLLLALALKIPLGVLLLEKADLSVWYHRALFVGVAVVADLILVGAAIVVAARQAWEAVALATVQKRGMAQNDAPRDEARRLVSTGLAGLITGHTHHPELAPVAEGFYANSGCSMPVVDERPARTGLPPVFLASRITSWVELEAAAMVRVRLVHGRRQLPGATHVEALAARKSATPDGPPAVVASFPDGAAWPAVENDAVRLRKTRTRAAVGIALIGLIDIVSALTPPLAERLRTLRDVMPFGVPRAAAALAALAGVGLLLLARGLRRGGRRAWKLAVLLLLGSTVLHLLKGVDVEEAVYGALAAVYLWARRSAFRAPSQHQSVALSLRIIGATAAFATLIATVVIELFPAHRPRLPIDRAVLASLGRLVGVTTVALPDRVGDFLTPALAAVGFGAIFAAGWVVFRPAVPHHKGNVASRDRARNVVARYGDDTLSYFALRDDKVPFFQGDTLIAYAVVGTVCLVSPDPVGPVSERATAWNAFHRFAAENGWSVAVMGAAEDWLPVYRDAGMHELYVGDEAIVDCPTFSLEGNRSKSLRQAVNRIARNGYRVEFHDPAHLAPEMVASLRKLMSESRRGDVERGFSMTLSRIFDPDDRGLLLSVCFGPDGDPVAFCQWVPALGIDGYSLDLMRRSKGEHPNGLLDFVVVETIRHLKDQGLRGLALNFATMRAVLAGETSGPGQRTQRWLLRKMSDSMQIESLWKYNEKFGPSWKPRYAVYDSTGDMGAAALAVAKAESFWELPVIGRFLVPDRPPAEPDTEPSEP
ncbi:MAG TPA: phosphatidylglycerol lysyltransferase domain-containing protein [Acidimicrobiales bacterium]|nr:phosphatidylglycerol lysyltransferase domain-containing protein [Acidimicrobiales bacterium]